MVLSAMKAQHDVTAGQRGAGTLQQTVSVCGNADCMPTLTLSRPFLARRGVAPGAVQGRVLRRDIAFALRPLLASHGFDVTRPTWVRKLDGDQGVHLTQP
jgi:hypothetical protein